ncbi:TolC family protein [Dyadobacter luteus]|uniref:TolC family protein n=2 Tax=Dyadobacter luteus TaxID=2259619 RepID=A0A3D8YF19_9BACT|nr:TolC family protein [Dyadobacter luteus]
MAMRNLIIIILLTCSFYPAVSQPGLTLQQALQTARENNPFLKSQALNVAMSQADIVTAGLRPNPVLNNQSLAQVRPSHYEPGTHLMSGKNQQIWWQLTKTFQTTAQRSNKIEFANKNAELSQKMLQETERNLLQDVALKWLDVWTLRKQLDLLQLAQNNTDSLITINKVRLKNEVIAQTDLVRTQLLAGQYKMEMKSAEQDYKNELINLQILLGEKKEVAIDTSDRFDLFAGKSLGIDSLLMKSDDRADLQALKTAVQTADANIKLQKSLAVPQPELGVIYNPQNTIPYLGVFATIDLPVFSRNQGEIQKSRIVKSQTEQEFAARRNVADSEIVTAQRSYQINKENLENFNTLLSQAQQILTSVSYSYLRGGTTIVDLLEAHRSWLETRQNYYRTLQQYRESYVKLLYVSGAINQLAN